MKSVKKPLKMFECYLTKIETRKDIVETEREARKRSFVNDMKMLLFPP